MENLEIEEQRHDSERIATAQVIKKETEKHTRILVLIKRGGDTLKFGDIIITAASLAIISKLIYLPLALAFTSPLGVYGGFLLSVVISILASAIITGYIYTQKIWEENRTKTITKTTVLLTAFVWLTALMESAASADWTPKIKAEWLTANPNATPSAFEWFYIENLLLNVQIFVAIALALALGFIGLYIGSMLKKSTKT